MAPLSPVLREDGLAIVHGVGGGGAVVAVGGNEDGEESFFKELVDGPLNGLFGKTGLLDDRLITGLSDLGSPLAGGGFGLADEQPVDGNLGCAKGVFSRDMLLDATRRD